jgi:hypothetical protein
MAGLSILKHNYNLSDEALCERWVENPYFQHFCGEEFFRYRLIFDRSSLTRWRQRMGEQKLQALLQESLAVTTPTEALKPSDLARVVVDIINHLFGREVVLWSGTQRFWPCPRTLPELCNAFLLMLCR